MYVKLCTVDDLVHHCVDSNFKWSIKSNQIDYMRLIKTLTSGKAVQGRRKHLRVAWVYSGGLRVELTRGALPLKLKAFSHLDVQWKQQNLLPAVLTVSGTIWPIVMSKQCTTAPLKKNRNKTFWRLSLAPTKVLASGNCDVIQNINSVSDGSKLSTADRGSLSSTET